MVKEATLNTRTHAVSLLEAGMLIHQVAKVVGVSICTIRRWLLRFKADESLQNRKGRGRKKFVTMVAKVVIAKTIGKKIKSTRYISKNLQSKGFSIFHVPVHSYLRKNLNVRPYKPQVQPKLTEKQRTVRVEFCNERKDGSFNTRKRVIFSDESPFQLLFHTPNKQNDLVWAKSRVDVPPTKKSNIMENHGMGCDVIPRPLRPPSNPPKTNCDIRLLCGSYIETVFNIQLISNERFRDDPREKIVAR
ncbi:hypothetical protein LOD99_10769 [Oopsacas minuta]|uniref:Transposase n=1 Tax=Oopsacas minuta TaxID=111878 RepID=A0AAV7KF35_9METZ|nr:hypothetical protein LOD99_10769 [Oopsacas minuta]